MADNIYVREFYPAGKIIITEGVPGHEMYIIDTGTVHIWKLINNEKKILATLGKGQVFGEMALIDSSVRMASAEAAEGGATLVKIPSTAFEEALNKCPLLIQKIMRSLVVNLRRLQ
jgi:CRP-like cAMP-binding protein